MRDDYPLHDSYPRWIRRERHRRLTNLKELAETDTLWRLHRLPRIRLGAYWSLPPLLRWRGRVLN